MVHCLCKPAGSRRTCKASSSPNGGMLKGPSFDPEGRLEGTMPHLLATVFLFNHSLRMFPRGMTIRLSFGKGVLLLISRT